MGKTSYAAPSMAVPEREPLPDLSGVMAENLSKMTTVLGEMQTSLSSQLSSIMEMTKPPAQKTALADFDIDRVMDQIKTDVERQVDLEAGQRRGQASTFRTSPLLGDEDPNLVQTVLTGR